MNAYSFNIKKWKCFLPLVAFILLPMLLIILQKETGSALVYLAFFLVLYREGMPGVVLFSGVCAVVYFVVGIRFDQVFISRYAYAYRRVCRVVDDTFICRFHGLGV